jgi:hypothetical protein
LFEDRSLDDNAGNMAETTRANRRLIFVKVDALELWHCRPLGDVPVLDLHDRRVGRLGGVLLDSDEERPRYLAIRRASASGRKWFLVPVGDAWFDETERAIRIDVPARCGATPAFDPERFERMTSDEAAAYERRVLAECCPEVGLHRDGTPDYGRQTPFQCPSWLRAQNMHATAQAPVRRVDTP